MGPRTGRQGQDVVVTSERVGTRVPHGEPAPGPGAWFSGGV